jgi:PPOX class probable F420-dependent enzyme
MTDDALVTFLGSQRRGVLVTLKKDGRPQLSVVGHSLDPATRTLRISVTDDRAKTRNLRRDPRATYMVKAPDDSAYVVADGTAELGPVTTDPADAAADDLVDLYRTLAGEHPDWDEFRAAMVEQRRLVLRIVIDHVYGATQGG